MAHDFEGFAELCDEIKRLHHNWKVFDQLFTSQSAVDLLTANGGTVFVLIQQGLLASMVLGIAKMVDPASWQDRETVSFQLMVKRARAFGDDRFAEELKKDLRELTKRCRKMERHRNRLYGHIDLRTAMRKDQLPKILRADMEAALQAIRDLANKISSYVGDPPVAYEHGVMLGDGDALLEALDRADYHLQVCEKQDWKVRVERRETRDRRAEVRRRDVARRADGRRGARR